MCAKFQTRCSIRLTRLPALIANNYGEMLSIPLYDSALLLAALILLWWSLFFNVVSRVILARIEKGTR